MTKYEIINTIAKDLDRVPIVGFNGMEIMQSAIRNLSALSEALQKEDAERAGSGNDDH